MAELKVYKDLLRYKDSQGNWHTFDAISGRDGVDGTTPQISAAVTALAAGQSPTVTVGGTTEAPVFTFGIPRGDTGQKGDKGDRGNDGVTRSLLFTVSLPLYGWSYSSANGYWSQTIGNIAPVPDTRDTSDNPQTYVLLSSDVATVGLDTTGLGREDVIAMRDEYAKIVYVSTSGESQITVHITAETLSLRVPLLLRVLR